MDIDIYNLRKTFGATVAVDIPALHIGAGELIGIVGNNGAGKTTLFRLMLDLLGADEGRVMLGDINPARSEAWKSSVGAYLDDSFLIDFLTPEEYFLFVGFASGLDEEETNRRLGAYERFMQGEILGQRKLIRTLSAGNKQKTGIIAALLPEPETVILDEPFNFLDPTSQHLLRRLLADYARRRNATILVSSHNLRHTTDLATRILLLERGRIIRDLSGDKPGVEAELDTYFAEE
ncbi:MAG: ABC transporter ATP-binding protein [Prevotella sp.]|nr:ABC transporter ATP-binding protein [Prevotella sp.]